MKSKIIIPILILAFHAVNVSAQNKDSGKAGKPASTTPKGEDSSTKTGPRASEDVNMDNEKYGAVSTSPRADRLTAELLPCSDGVCSKHLVSSGPRDVDNCMLPENITLPACPQNRGTSSGAAEENGDAGGQ